MERVKKAIAALQAGKPIILVDHEHRENEGDFVCSAEAATPEMINFFIKQGRGLVCLTMGPEDAERLDLRMMVASNNSKYQTAFTESIEGKIGIETGISPKDRSTTILKAVDSKSSSKDFVRPGHVFPLIARPLGTLERQGQTEGSVDLCKLAGLKPMGVICEIINDDGTMARSKDLQKLSLEFDLVIVSVEEVRRYRWYHEKIVLESGKSILPTELGTFQIEAFKDPTTNKEHMALWLGDIRKEEKVLTRIHSSCVTSEVFGSLRCDCENQLKKSMKLIKEKGSGLIIYLNQEGRGLGLYHKIKAYREQDLGKDTYEANLAIGRQVDEREYFVAVQILNYFGIKKVELLTNNKNKLESLESFFEVSRRPIFVENLNPLAKKYLDTKIAKMGHMSNEERL